MENARMTVCVMVAVILVGSLQQAKAAEVWLNKNNRSHMQESMSVGRVTSDGTLLSALNLGNYVRNLTVVGDEVWFNNQTSNFIHRVSFDGTALPNFSTGVSVEDFALVGNEIWCSRDSNFIRRQTLDGTVLSDYAVSMNNVRELVVIPEPCSLFLLALGCLMLRRRKQ